jgi:hypothetical protein
MTRNYDSALEARLFPWTIVRQLPNLQQITVGRFRNRSDAEGHLQVLKQLIPQSQFAIVFDLSMRQ